MDELTKTASPKSTGPDIQTQECVQLCRQVVAEAVETLPPEDRFLLYALHGDGLPGREVAAMMGIHPGNVSRRADRAREQLRELLDSPTRAREQSHPGFADCWRLLQTESATTLGQLMLDCLRMPTQGEKSP